MKKVFQFVSVVVLTLVIFPLIVLGSPLFFVAILGWKNGLADWYFEKIYLITGWVISQKRGK